LGFSQRHPNNSRGSEEKEKTGGQNAKLEEYPIHNIQRGRVKVFGHIQIEDFTRLKVEDIAFASRAVFVKGKSNEKEKRTKKTKLANLD
jgi:hypothetical protein